MGKRRRRISLGSIVPALAILLILGCVITLWLPLLLPEPQWLPEKKKAFDNKIDHTPLAELNCQSYGGPKDASEMIYWKDYPSDAAYVSPFYSDNKATKYLTFEPDKGGWNNVRMSLETIIVMAHAMGRTLVMVCTKEHSVATFAFFYLCSSHLCV